jgi:formate/nitrite transporter FocA (FNT family)
MNTVNRSSPQEIGILITRAGKAKAQMRLVELAVKSFLGGVFFAIGGLFDLVVVGGSPGLRESNPSLVTLITAFTFPIGMIRTATVRE